VDIAEGLSDLVAEFLDVYLRKLLTLAELFNPTVNFVFHLCVIIASASVVRERKIERVLLMLLPGVTITRHTSLCELKTTRTAYHHCHGCK